MVRIFIGLVIPFIAIVVVIPFVNAVDVRIFEIPFVFVWMFCWFVLTSVCLAICWFVFDRHRGEEDYGI
jgi:Protein of unknown function (DUF3311)